MGKKYAPYSRRELRRQRKDWLRRNLVLVACFAAGTFAILVLLTVCLLAVPHPSIRWYAIGTAHVALGAMAFHLVNTAFVAHTGGAVHQIRGAWGEEATRSELVTARRRRRIWGWVDSIRLRDGDLDHLVVTRSAGVVVIDSKWRTRAIRPDEADRMAESAQRAATRAEGVLRSKLGRERGAHRARVPSFTVTPVVVVWGVAQDDLPPYAERVGVRFVRGRHLQEWLRSLEGEPVPKDVARDLIARIQEFRESAWAGTAEPAGTRSPASLRRSSSVRPPTAARR